MNTIETVSSDDDPIPESLITQISHRAMATDFVVMLPAPAADAINIAVETLETLDSIESDLTIYQPGSEISRINREAADRPVRVSRRTFALLKRSLFWSERTGGAFDITAGPLIEAWGFTRRRGRKPSRDEIIAAAGLVGYQKVSLDSEADAVSFRVAGMSINLGAIGKGAALDCLARQLKSAGVKDFLIHGGNSSMIAAGDQSPGSDLGWAVGLAHPTKPQRRLAGLWLRNSALSTSGSGKQFFHHRGRRYGHVIDPRTGYPAGDLLSLTVLMPGAADADACSTGLFVVGSAAIQSLVERATAEARDVDSWATSPMILASSGHRQDDVDVETIGSIRWIDPPKKSTMEERV